MLPTLQGGATERGADVGWTAEATCAPCGGAPACVPGAALRKAAHPEPTRCLALIGSRSHGRRAAAAIVTFGSRAITRLQSTAFTCQQPSRRSLRVQMGHEMCHNLPYPMGEENKPP